MIFGSMLMMAIGSSIRGRDLAGNYELVGEQETTSHLILKPDGAFEFGLSYRAADFWGEGKWKQEQGSVILDSTSKPEPPFRLMRSAAGKKDGRTRIWVTGQNGRGIPYIKVILHSSGAEQTTHTTAEGLAEFPPVEGSRAVVFRVQVYGVETAPEVLKAADREFYFELNGKRIQEIRFENERAKVSGKTLELNVGGSRHALRYQRR
jgi:hypothetical protein